MEKASRTLSIHLGADLKARWLAYCNETGISPGAAIKEAINQELEKASPIPPPKTYQQNEAAPGDERKTRFEILLTSSEKAALAERCHHERCSPRRWIVDAIRAGLTKEPQFTMREIEALGKSNYHLLAIGRNLNQVTKVMNETHRDLMTIEATEKLTKIIHMHTERVSQAIRASLERWNLE